MIAGRLILAHCEFWVADGAAWTGFTDGSTCANYVPLTADGAPEPSFCAVARECGFTDPWSYLVQHELLHSLVPEMLFGRPGYVVRMMASGRKCDLAAAGAEELLIHFVSRLAADSDFPCPDPRWHDVVRRTRALLAELAP